MVLYRVMNEVFRSWTHVAVMRALFDTTNGLTGNAVARNAHMHPRSAFKALTALETLHLVRRQRGGRDHIFTLNREHTLFAKVIVPVYQEERVLRAAVEGVLAAQLSPLVISAVIFGSVARHEETPGSDLDLCCITKTEQEKDRVRVLLNDNALAYAQTYGIAVAPVLFTKQEFRRQVRSGLIKEIVKEGKVISGQSPEKVLHG